MDHLMLLEHAEGRLVEVIHLIDESEMDLRHQLPAVDGPC